MSNPTLDPTSPIPSINKKDQTQYNMGECLASKFSSGMGSRRRICGWDSDDSQVDGWMDGWNETRFDRVV